MSHAEYLQKDAGAGGAQSHDADPAIGGLGAGGLNMMVLYYQGMCQGEPEAAKMFASLLEAFRNKHPGSVPALLDAIRHIAADKGARSHLGSDAAASWKQMHTR